MGQGTDLPLLPGSNAAPTLSHPNIITIHEIGRTKDGRAFIAMEHVDGRTLRSTAGQPNAVRDVARLGRQVAEALAAAHALGIIHRGAKPENIMVRADRCVTVLGFGLVFRRSRVTLTLLDARAPARERLGSPRRRTVN